MVKSWPLGLLVLLLFAGACSPGAVVVPPVASSTATPTASPSPTPIPPCTPRSGPGVLQRPGPPSITGLIPNEIRPGSAVRIIAEGFPPGVDLTVGLMRQDSDGGYVALLSRARSDAEGRVDAMASIQTDWRMAQMRDGECFLISVAEADASFDEAAWGLIRFFT